MGILRLRFKAKRGSKREVLTGVVDSGADVTTLNLDTACELGLEPETAPSHQMRAPGGVILTGYLLDGVELSYKKRSATITVFVPVEAQATNGSVEPAARNEEQLIGHDFLQAAGATADFAAHDLATPPTYKQLTSRRTSLRPATLVQRARLRARAASCPSPKRRRTSGSPSK